MSGYVDEYRALVLRDAPEPEAEPDSYLWCVGWVHRNAPVAVYLFENGTTEVSLTTKAGTTFTVMDPAELAAWRPNWIFFWAHADGEGNPIPE